MKKLRPLTAFFNKQYQDCEDGAFLKKLQTIFLSKLRDYYGKNLPDHIFFADDCFVAYRNLGFLNDPHFIEAVSKSNLDSVLMGRIWRIWFLAWSMSIQWRSEGLSLDCGTYNGSALKVAIAYSQKLYGESESTIFAIDLFDDPPRESRKTEHGPQLEEQTRLKLSEYKNVRVFRGSLPLILNELNLSSVKWCQIDLNSAQADAETFIYLQDYLAPGAHVIFDDYGFSRYKGTQELLDRVLTRTNERIFELPTGQGLYIKS
jgi:O-methyltransferase